MIEYLTLALAAVVVLVLLLLRIVIASLLSSTQQVLQMNKQLMVLVGTRDGGEKVGRALVESMKEPKKNLPGVVKDPPQREEVRPTGKSYSLKIGSE